ncbi:MAG TPA: ABC transporter ATP-binding protein [Acidimicrobiia bacterium]|nr:ABC transporter ATP-binding protein [Acidimicrobiia bacterium]
MTLALRLDGISKVYADDVVALEQVDLTIEAGDYVALTGPSGSGKTTLLNLVGLLDTPTGGALWFEGDDTRDWTDRDRSRARADALGFVFQSYHLFEDRTVTDNVEIGLVHQRRNELDRPAELEKAIAAVGLQHRAHASARTLSGGERQRVAIARAIARQPRILLCDEPVGNLDGGNAEIVLDEIDHIHKSGVTVVMVTHDPRSAARALRVVKLRNGRVVDLS